MQQKVSVTSLTELIGLVQNDLAQAVFMLDGVMQTVPAEDSRSVLNEVINGLLLSNESLRLIAKHFDAAAYPGSQHGAIAEDPKLSS